MKFLCVCSDISKDSPTSPQRSPKRARPTPQADPEARSSAQAQAAPEGVSGSGPATDEGTRTPPVGDSEPSPATNEGTRTPHVDASEPGPATGEGTRTPPRDGAEDEGPSQMPSPKKGDNRDDPLDVPDSSSSSSSHSSSDGEEPSPRAGSEPEKGVPELALGRPLYSSGTSTAAGRSRAGASTSGAPEPFFDVLAEGPAYFNRVMASAQAEVARQAAEEERLKAWAALLARDEKTLNKAKERAGAHIKRARDEVDLQAARNQELKEYLADELRRSRVMLDEAQRMRSEAERKKSEFIASQQDFLDSVDRVRAGLAKVRHGTLCI